MKWTKTLLILAAIAALVLGMVAGVAVKRTESDAEPSSDGDSSASIIGAMVCLFAANNAAKKRKIDEQRKKQDLS